MKHLAILLIIFGIHLAAFAAVPLRWKVETSRVQPVAFDAYHGEEIALEATLQSYGKPLAIPANADVRMFWQTNGMGSVYWSTNATLASSNVISAAFLPSFDPGAAVVRGFLGIPGSNYRAAFGIRFRGSPGATPFTPPPLPSYVYYNKDEIDALLDSTDEEIFAASNASTNYTDAATNATLTAANAYTDAAITGAGSVTPQIVTNIANAAIAATGCVTTNTAGNGEIVGDWNLSTTKVVWAGQDLREPVSDWANATECVFLGRIPPVFDYDEESLGYIYGRTADRNEGVDGIFVVLNSSYGIIGSYIQDYETDAITHSGSVNPSDIAEKNDVLTDTQHLFAANTASSWLSVTEYKIGDFALYNGNAYICVAAGNKGETPVSGLRTGHWVKATYVELFGTNNVALTSMIAAATNSLQSVTSNTVASTWGFISQATADAAYYPKASGEAWSSYWDGDDVRVTVTNYDSAVNLPSLYLEQKTNEVALATNLFRTVWREMAHWETFLGTNWNWRTAWSGFKTWAANIESVLAEKADRAWGFYDSHTGEYAPDGYTQISSEHILIAKGMGYQKTVTTSAEVWVLTANEPYEPTGVSTNGGFQIKDSDGNIQFEIVKGDKATVPAQAFAVAVTNGTLYVTYNIIAATHPTCEVCLSLTNAAWKAETESDCLATVAWSGSSGAYVAAITPKSSTSSCFVKATYQRGGDTYINNRCAVGMSQLVLGGVTYDLGTATIDGNTVLTLTPAD